MLARYVGRIKGAHRFVKFVSLHLASLQNLDAALWYAFPLMELLSPWQNEAVEGSGTAPPQASFYLCRGTQGLVAIYSGCL